MRMIAGRLISHHIKTKIRFWGTINSNSRNYLSSSSSSSVLNVHNHSRPFSSSSAAATLPRSLPEDEPWYKTWYRNSVNRPDYAFIRDGADTNEKIIGFAQFAVDQHNLQENESLRFVRVVRASDQMVAGRNYFITLEAADSAGQSKIYFAAVYSRPWEKLTRLLIWKAVDESFKYPCKEISGYHYKILTKHGLNAAKEAGYEPS